jgi:hypothetical protein
LIAYAAAVGARGAGAEELPAAASHARGALVADKGAIGSGLDGIVDGVPD